MTITAVTVGNLLEKGLIKKSTKVLVDVEKLKKNNLLKINGSKLALLSAGELKQKGLIK